MNVDLNVLEARCLNLNRGTKLSKMNLHLTKGKIYALIGISGAGKTSLLRVIAGLEGIAAGELSLFGKSDKKGLAEGRKRIGALIDRPAFIPEFSINKNLRVQFRALGGGDRQYTGMLRKALGFSNLLTGNRRMSRLTTEQKLLFGIVLALMGKPDLLLLDEPLIGLDHDNRIRLGEVLKETSDKGKTTLLTSKTVSDVLETGIVYDYLFMDKGRIIGVLDQNELERRMKDLGDPDRVLFEMIKEVEQARRGEHLECEES